MPSDLLLALAKYNNNPVGVPSVNEQEAVNAYLRIFKEIPEETIFEELPTPRIEDIALLAGVEVPPMPPNIEDVAIGFYDDIKKLLPATLLSLISSSNLDDTLLKWYYLAILAKKNIITFESGTSLENHGETSAFLEDVEVIQL